MGKQVRWDNVTNITPMVDSMTLEQLSTGCSVNSAESVTNYYTRYLNKLFVPGMFHFMNLLDYC